MAQNTQSKILSIEEQIQKLQEKKKREIAKLERSTGKRFLEKFKVENKSLEEIYTFIDLLEENHHIGYNDVLEPTEKDNYINMSEINNDQPNK